MAEQEHIYAGIFAPSCLGHRGRHAVSCHGCTKQLDQPITALVLDSWRSWTAILVGIPEGLPRSFGSCAKGCAIMEKLLRGNCAQIVRTCWLSTRQDLFDLVDGWTR